ASASSRAAASAQEWRVSGAVRRSRQGTTACAPAANTISAKQSAAIEDSSRISGVGRIGRGLETSASGALGALAVEDHLVRVQVEAGRRQLPQPFRTALQLEQL